MPSIFTSLNTAYTGLSAHQTMVDTTGHNIANASTELYSRQIVQTSNTSLNNIGNFGTYGIGVNVDTIKRLHDEYVFSRYITAAGEQEYSQTKYDVLRTVSAYLPDVQQKGMYNDLQEYFNAWKDFSEKSSDPAQRIVLAEKTQTLATTIRETRNRLYQLQLDINEEAADIIKKVNDLGQEIANINRQITMYEREDKLVPANDLRDERDRKELQLSKLIGGQAFKEALKVDGMFTDSVDFTEDYSYKIANGYTLVDGVSFHPLAVDNSKNPEGFYNFLYTKQDWKHKDLTSDLREGKLGALLATGVADVSKSATATLGDIQRYINMLDTFAAGLIEATNNIYAQSAAPNIRGDFMENLDANEAVVSSGYPFREGSFDVVLYNSVGDEIARKTVTIDGKTTMNDILTQLNTNSDDNNDGNANNDFDDYFEAVYNNKSRTFQINPKAALNIQEITIGVEDKGSNIAGALGLNRFFEGRDARDINLVLNYREDPTTIKAYKANVTGNHDVANAMIQLQYDNVMFREYDGTDHAFKLFEYYKNLAGQVANDTADAKANNDLKTTVLASAKEEHDAISGVSLDEELTNLIQFQAGYTANAKVVSTLDEIINTLLGLKQ
ncbi:MAG: flagellar hook-associated protein FlgK [Helicobacter sp.]|nr:flagellar hook-associated protein FlgK [Helicobacter sp.]